MKSESCRELDATTLRLLECLAYKKLHNLNDDVFSARIRWEAPNYLSDANAVRKIMCVTRNLADYDDFLAGNFIDIVERFLDAGSILPEGTGAGTGDCNWTEDVLAEMDGFRPDKVSGRRLYCWRSLIPARAATQRALYQVTYNRGGPDVTTVWCASQQRAEEFIAEEPDIRVLWTLIVPDDKFVRFPLDNSPERE